MSDLVGKPRVLALMHANAKFYRFGASSVVGKLDVNQVAYRVYWSIMDRPLLCDVVREDRGGINTPPCPLGSETSKPGAIPAAFAEATI